MEVYRGKEVVKYMGKELMKGLGFKSHLGHDLTGWCRVNNNLNSNDKTFKCLDLI